MTAVNTATLHSVIHGGIADRAQAAKDYLAILFDPTRTSDEDKATLAAAMETLGKTAQDAIHDQRLFVEVNQFAREAVGHDESKKQLDAARDALNLFLNKTKKEMFAEIERLEDQHRQTLSTADQKHVRLLTSLLNLRRRRFHNPHLAKHIPGDPVGSPDEIHIRGQHYNPADGPKPDPRTAI